MATLSNQEIELLKQQLKEKTKEVKAIYDKLVEAGVIEVSDDFLDEVAGGGWGIFYGSDLYGTDHHGFV
ncbi:MAG: hypothetical protein J5720_00820 [Bacteroidaceae bacterium]|nr:hypothetical protein [Bacteroidaceae bacterium]